MKSYSLKFFLLGIVFALSLTNCGKSRNKKRIPPQNPLPIGDDNASVSQPLSRGKIYFSENKVHGWFCTNLGNLNEVSLSLFAGNRPGQTGTAPDLQKSLLPLDLLSPLNPEAISLCGNVGPIFKIALSDQENSSLLDSHRGKTLFATLFLENSQTSQRIDLLNSGFISLPTLCSASQTESRNCSVENGQGSQQRACTANGSWSDFNSCVATSCNAGFQLSGGRCLANQSSVIPTCTFSVARQGTSPTCDISIQSSGSGTNFSVTPQINKQDPVPGGQWMIYQNAQGSWNGNNWVGTVSCPTDRTTAFSSYLRTLQGGLSEACSGQPIVVAPVSNTPQPTCTFSVARQGTSPTCDISIQSSGSGTNFSVTPQINKQDPVPGGQWMIYQNAQGSWNGNNWVGTVSCATDRTTAFSSYLRTLQGGLSETCSGQPIVVGPVSANGPLSPRVAEPGQTVRPFTNGFLDGIPQGGTHFGGWACQFNLRNSLFIKVYVGNQTNKKQKLIGTFTADQPEERAVSRSCSSSANPLGGSRRFLIPTSIFSQEDKNKRFYIFAIRHETNIEELVPFGNSPGYSATVP